MKNFNIEAFIGYGLWVVLGVALFLKVVGIDLWL